MIVVTVLSILAAGFAYSMRVEMRLARNSNADPTMEWIGRSGVELAKYVIALEAQTPGGSVQALNQKWAGGIGTDTNGQLSQISLTDNYLGKGKFSVKIVDSERKFNINRVQQSETILRRALEVMGMDPGTDSVISDSILDWLDRDEDNRLSGTESDYYMTLDPPYAAKNGLIDDINELLYIRGITPDVFWGPQSNRTDQVPYEHQMGPGQRGMRRARRVDLPPDLKCGLNDLFSAFSAGPININTAGIHALQLIAPFIDEHAAAAIIEYRKGPDGVEGNEDDIVFQNAQQLGTIPGMTMPPDMLAGMNAVAGGRSATYEIEVDVELDGIKRKYYAVVRRVSGRELVTLTFYWK